MWKIYDLEKSLFDDTEEFPSISIQSDLELRQELDRYRSHDPSMFTLESPGEDILFMGLGGLYAVVQWPTERGGPLLTAYTDTIHTRALVEFTMEGIGSPFCPENLLLASEAIEVIVHFFKTRKPADWVKWGPRVWPKSEYVPKEPVWELLDTRDPLGTSAYCVEFPTTHLPDEETLRRELEHYRKRSPSTLILRSANGDCLRMGLGGAYGTVKWAPSDHHEPTRVAYVAKPIADTSVGFLREGVTEEVSSEHLLPAEEAIKLAIHFFRRHELADWAEWRSLSSRRGRDKGERQRGQETKGTYLIQDKEDITN